MILRLKSKGPKVIELQLFLKVPATSVFDRVTLDAVKKFQVKNKLKPDGIVGPKTWAAIAKQVESNKVKPLYEDVKAEDKSDLDVVKDLDLNEKESAPTSKHILELISLIENANITRKIRRLVFHCTATRQTATVSAIQKYWREKRKWTAPGYHIIIKPDGSWTLLQDFNRISNGVANINSTTINVSYIGGIDSKGNAFDNRTDAQKEVLEVIWRAFKHKLPNITFHGHYEFQNKSCPSFNVQRWIKSLES
jgi:N-acetylmuramoyl-L-alanine amidase